MPRITRAVRDFVLPLEPSGSLDASRNADVIIGDYNYALSPSSTLARFFGDEQAQARNLLLIDEAHNLPSRATAWFSPALDLAQLGALKNAWKGKRTGLKGRFLEPAFARCFPQGWFAQSPQEAVSGGILADVLHFWNLP